MKSNRSLLPRNLALLSASMLTVMAGATIAPALPCMDAHFAAIPNASLLVKLVLTVPALLIALTAAVMGLLVDKLGRRVVLVSSLLLFAVAGTSGYFLNTLTTILIGRVFLGIAVGGIMTSLTALIAGYFRDDGRTRFLGYQAATSSFGGMFFLILGGKLAEMGWRMPFLIYALALPIAIFLVLALPRCPEKLLSNSVDKLATSPDQNQWNPVYTACGLGFFGMVVFYLIPTGLPFHLESAFSASPTQGGIAIGCATLVGGIVSLLNRYLRQRLSFKATMSMTFSLMGIAFVIVYLAPSFSMILVAMLFAGAGMGMLLPNLSLLTMNSVTESSTGRAAGLLTTCIFLGQFVSPLVSSPIGAYSSSGMTFGIFGIGMLITAGVIPFIPKSLIAEW